MTQIAGALIYVWKQKHMRSCAFFNTPASKLVSKTMQISVLHKIIMLIPDNFYLMNIFTTNIFIAKLKRTFIVPFNFWHWVCYCVHVSLWLCGFIVYFFFWFSRICNAFASYVFGKTKNLRAYTLEYVSVEYVHSLFNSSKHYHPTNLNEMEMAWKIWETCLAFLNWLYKKSACWIYFQCFNMKYKFLLNTHTGNDVSYTIVSSDAMYLGWYRLSDNFELQILSP